MSEITERLDCIIALLEKMSKPLPLGTRIAQGIATGAGILGILSVVDILKNWIWG